MGKGVRNKVLKEGMPQKSGSTLKCRANAKNVMIYVRFIRGDIYQKISGIIMQQLQTLPVGQG